MLSKNQRLSRAEFQEMTDRKKRFSSPSFLLTVTYTSETKASVVVAKKVASKAVVRNALRRLLYRCLQELLPKFTRKAYVVVKAKSNMRSISADETIQELERLLKDANLLPA